MMVTAACMSRAVTLYVVLNASTYPIVLYKSYVVCLNVNAQSFQTAQVQLLGVARVRLHDDLKLSVALHPVWVVTISAVIWSH